MNQNQKIIVVLLIGAIAYYYLEYEKKTKGPSGTGEGTGTGATGAGTGTGATGNDDFNEIKGFQLGNSLLDADSLALPVASLKECYDLSVAKDALAYIYRNEKHVQFPKTCMLLSHAGTGEIVATDDHSSGCTNKKQDFTKGCLNYNAGFKSGGTSIEGQNSIPVENVTKCQQLAKINNALGYNYRTDAHPTEELRKTCTLMSSMGTGDYIGKGDHITGCADVSKNERNGCN